MENDQNYKVTCDSVKVTTLFCFPCGAGVKRLLSEGSVSRNSLARCKAGGLGAFNIPGSVTAASRDLLGVQKLCQLPAPSHSMPGDCPGVRLTPGKGFGSVYHSCQGGEFLVTLVQLCILERPAKGGVGRLIGVLFPACDCWSSRGEIKSSSPAAAEIPGLIFIS